MAQVYAEPSDAVPVGVGGGRDPFILELIKNALVSAADEMALTVARTARSFVIKEALDYSTALFNARGDLIAQGTCLPLHLGAMPSAVLAVRKEFGEDMHPGDLFALNDPYDGGTHLPDIVCVLPIFHDDALVGFSAVLAHQTDIGGRVPGGNASDSTEIYQEGLRIPPVRLYDRGTASHTMFRILERNVRVPDKVLGDVRSQISACRIGERELLKLIAKYGPDELEAYCQELLDYTERFTRSEIAKLPDGAYEFTDYLDGDGIDPGAIKFHVKITVDGDAMVIDFTGTAPQVRGAINSVAAFTASASWACVRSILDLNIPNNAGYFRPIEVVLPARSIVNPSPPAPVAARGLTGFRIADTIFGALAQIRPDLVPASGSSSPDAGISFGGYDAEGNPYVFLEFLVGSWGGGPWRDGMEACTGMIINYSNTPAEMLESEQPLSVECYRFVPDTAGAGEYRGGLAMERHIRFRAESGIVQVRSDRRDIQPYGLEGGEPGAASDVSLTRADGREETFPAKFLTEVRQGDVLRIQLAGGGGYGDALVRDPARVLDDVMEGKVTPAKAKQAYGVVISGMPAMVDTAATETLRREMAAAR